MKKLAKKPHKNIKINLKNLSTIFMIHSRISFKKFEENLSYYVVNEINVATVQNSTLNISYQYQYRELNLVQ